MNTYNQQKKTKLRFLVIYALSLVLIFVVVTAFWQRKSAISEDVITQQAEGETYFLQFDTLLHPKLDQLDNIYTLFLNAPPNSTARMDSFFSAKNSMKTTLDSITEQASILKNGAKKTAMEMIVRRYRNSLEIRERLIGELNSMPIDKTLSKPEAKYADTLGANSDLERLRNIVSEKDQQLATLEWKAQVDLKEKNDLISSLQSQLKQNPPGVTTNSSSATASEWKQKYSSLKASYDRVAESEKALKNAYKTVAEDNRRLLSQLQSMKKG